MEACAHCVLWRLAICLLLSLTVAQFKAAIAENVYVIDTAKRPHSLDFANAINQTCPSCRPVKYMDMQGSHRLARQIGITLDELQQKKELDLVVTIGTPATLLVARTLDDIPIFHSLAVHPLPESKDTPNLFDAEAIPPLSLQLQALKTMAPDILSVGFLGTRETLAPQRALADEAANLLGVRVKFYYVKRPYDVPAGLRTAIQEMDGLIFLRDPVVVSADTINYLLQMTLENQIPTLGYSDRLVERGMLAALTANPKTLGYRLGTAIQHYLDTGEKPDLEMDATLFQLHINSATIKQTPKAEAIAPSGVGLVLR